MTMKLPFALLLSGEPNCGKSTLAYHLVQKRLRNCLVIDGDKHREMQFLGEKLGFTRDDIMRNTDHVIKLARFAQDQGFNVLIPQITPYLEQRQAMSKVLDNYWEVFVYAPKEVRMKRPNFTDSELIYEYGVPDLIVNTANTIDTCVNEILLMLNSWNIDENTTLPDGLRVERSDPR